MKRAIQQLTSRLQRMSSQITDHLRILQVGSKKKPLELFFSALGFAPKSEPVFVKIIQRQRALSSPPALFKAPTSPSLHYGVDDIRTIERRLQSQVAVTLKLFADFSWANLPQDIASIDISHSRVFSFGMIDAGIGYETIDDAATGDSFSDARGYIQWRSSY